jgi:hypothetical protein
MTSQRKEFIGKEPSLKTLANFIKINKKEFDNYNADCIANNNEIEKLDYTVMAEYLDFANRYSNGEYYYIGGHIKTNINDPITEEAINQATKKNIESMPQHMMEVASKARSSKQLNNLRKIIDIYYEKCLEEYYAPPSIFSDQPQNQLQQNSCVFSWLICGDNNKQPPYTISRRDDEGCEKVTKNTMIGKTTII